MMKRGLFCSHLAAFACGVLLVSGVSMTAPHRVASGVYGDVNGDGSVDVDDLNEVINVILGLPHGGTSEMRTYTVNGVSFTMVDVEGGTFTMGATAEQGSDAYDWERPAHEVTVSDFSIGETEVTQALWQAVMGRNPSWFNGIQWEPDEENNDLLYADYATNLQRPVEYVSWHDCQQFITKLNQLTGENFRLPTEAEWEFAARGGNKSRGYKYAGSDNIDEVAWYWGNIPSQSVGTTGYGTQTVATKAPNELGLYDMSGNVSEWCQDWWERYDSDALSNAMPAGEVTANPERGGQWSGDAKSCRVSSRFPNDSYFSYLYLGLRLAR